ncbi:AlkZ-related protein [Paenibacillus mendelii]|uniref:AlkZ-related protein n=1 Tax=Paenibacillus mendelii TaxID=206163 RepID=UPI001D34E99A
MVITGAKENDTNSGWSSMCYELSEQWLNSNGKSGQALSMEEAKDIMREELTKTCSSPAYKYFAKKLGI